MKMTMNIDEALLQSAMELTGTTSKTAAVDLALKELVRQESLLNVLQAGSGLTPDELALMFDPAYDLDAMRRAEIPSKRGRARTRR